MWPPLYPGMVDIQFPIWSESSLSVAEDDRQGVVVGAADGAAAGAVGAQVAAVEHLAVSYTHLTLPTN